MPINTRSSGPKPGGGFTDQSNLNVSADWEEVDDEVDYTRGAVIDIIGPEGTGRSTLALTMGGPIAYINSDEKIDGIIQPVARTGKIGRAHV